MGVLDRIRSIFNRGMVAPPNPSRSTFWPVAWDADGRYFGAQEALQLSTVWACVSAISRSLAACEWKVYKKTAGALNYIEGDDLEYLLNTRPNPEMTAIAFREALVASAAVWGNGYAEIVRDQAGRVKELWPLDPTAVEAIRVDPVSRLQAQTGELIYRVTQPDGSKIELTQAQVYHLRGPSLTGLLGENMVLRAAKSLILTSAADTFATSYYRNNTVVGGVLEYPRTLDQKSFDRLKADWVEKHSGPSQGWKPIILENGMQWKQMGDQSAQSSQMLEARKFQVEEIARWFGVPLHMIGSLAGSQGYGTNLELLSIAWVRDCLGPWAKRCEQEADWKFFPMRGPTASKQTKMDLTPLTRGDAKTRAEAYAVMRRIGVYSANDILRLEGQNALPGEEGDVRLVEASMAKYGELDAREDKAEKDAEAPTPAPGQMPGAPPETDEDPQEDTEDTTEEK